MTEGRFRLAVAAIVITAAVAYAPVLRAPYYFDDYSLLTDPLVQQSGGWQHLFDLDRTRPLTYLSFWISYAPPDGDAVCDHTVNLGIFLALVVLAAAVYRSLLSPGPAALAVAVLALHPAATEATAYVFARASLLAALLCVAAWLLWLRDRPWWSVGAMLLALLAKEEAAGFVLFLAAFEVFYRRSTGHALLRRVKPLAAMAALVAAAFLRVLYAAHANPGSGAVTGVEGVTAWTYFWTQGRVIWQYLARFVAPVGWNFDREFPLSQGPDAVALASWAALLLLGAGLAYLARRRKEWFWPLGAVLLFLPTSSVVPLADATADRRMLLPLLAFAPAVSAALGARLSGRALAAAALAVALPLAYATHRRATQWSDAETLWRDTVAKSPDKVRPKLHLAQALEPRGEAAWGEREKLLREAVALAPESPQASQELGLFLLTSRRPGPALEPLRRASELDPRSAQPLANLGAAYLMIGRLGEADEAFRQALERDPCSFDARNNLMLLERSRGDEARAREIAEEAPPGCAWSAQQSAAMAAAKSL